VSYKQSGGYHERYSHDQTHKSSPSRPCRSARGSAQRIRASRGLSTVRRKTRTIDLLSASRNPRRGLTIIKHDQGG
jgi:hypothetical protein